ncbi:MAG: hypothetical protein CXT69_01715 [Methanobacteriota archaeon]|jgi:hypothetical protein|nr:MAG: hypothetical protein CXT69_01715 [Euryarchaeota archaeon]HIK79001.1 hypothetical protein [Candidatus Poseidoniales archaeon]
MARAKFMLLLLLTSVFSGCLGAEITNWGDDGIEVNWAGPAKNVSIDTAFGDNSKMQNMKAIGCDDNKTLPTNSQAATWETMEPVTITGWLSALHHFTEGAGNSETSLSNALSTSVVIEKMSWEDAVKQHDDGGMGARVQVKDWGDPVDNGNALPYSPKTAGHPKLDGSGDAVTNYAVAGLIPATEEVLEGTEALRWHTPVKISGYLLYSPGVSSSDYYPTSVLQTLRSGGKCELYRLGTDGFRGNMLVTKIETVETTISLESGYSAPVGGVNTWLFTMLVLAIGGGGAFGVFTISTIIQRQGASAAAKVLLGREGMAAAKSVISDSKQAKKDGLEHTGVRKKAKQDAAEAKKTKHLDVEDVEIKGFDLESILKSGPSEGGVKEASGGGVVLTQEAEVFEEDLESGAFTPPEIESGGYDIPSRGSRDRFSDGEASRGSSMFSGNDGNERGVVSLTDDNPRSIPKKEKHFSSMGSSLSSSPIKEKQASRNLAVRKTRRAKSQMDPQDQPQVQEQPKASEQPGKRGPPKSQPKRSSPSVAEDDFSDFSL